MKAEYTDIFFYFEEDDNYIPIKKKRDSANALYTHIYYFTLKVKFSCPNISFIKRPLIMSVIKMQLQHN